VCGVVCMSRLVVRPVRCVLCGCRLTDVNRSELGNVCRDCEYSLGD
jgi:hypothetical protein